MINLGSSNMRHLVNNSFDLVNNVTFTVGTGGADFRYLTDAFVHLKRIVTYPSYMITLKLVSDIVQTHTINLNYSDFRNVWLDGNGYTISRACSDQWDVIFYADRAVYPTFKNVTIVNSLDNRKGIAFTNYHGTVFSSHPGNNPSLTLKGFWNGIRNANGHVFIPGLTIDNCEYGIYNFRKANLCLDSGQTIKNCNCGIFVATGSECQVSGVTFTNNTRDCNIAFNTPSNVGTVWK